MNKRASLATVLGGVVLALGGCDTSHSDSPDPCGLDQDKCKDIINPRVMKNPEGFRNVIYGCDAIGDMIYVTSRGQASATSDLVVIPNDPRCKGIH